VTVHAEQPKSGRRHPLEVTSDRLADFLDQYGARLDGEQRDMVSRVRHLLETLAKRGEQS
jgi:hypothetical protein